MTELFHVDCWLRGRISRGPVLNGSYEIDHPLGVGGWARIQGPSHHGGDPVAIKVIRRSFWRG